jgi:uncharacterized protein (TIGR00369 family)
MKHLTTERAGDILAAEFAPWIQELRIEVLETDGRGCLLRMPVSERLYRGGGILSGQAMMALADTAMVIAFCSAFGEFRPITTVDLSTSFLRPASSAVEVRANVIRAGRSLCFGEAILSSAGKEICRATGTYMLTPGPRE